MIENRVLKKTFGAKKEDVTKGQRKVLSKRLHDVCTPITKEQWANGIKGETGVACGNYGVEQKRIQHFGGEAYRKKTI
jgi:hypothetical protein